MELSAKQFQDYEFLDAGNGARLERFGAFLFDRPASVALWDQERPDLWPKADGTYQRTSNGSGHWEFVRSPPPRWPLRFEDLTFLVKPTGFGHMGIFPEHSCHWDWVAHQIRRAAPPCRILHLFAYTGAMTLLAARHGAEVCHVDAVRDINDWARENAAASGLAAAPIRWITDDVTKFVAREVRRKRQYEGIILDPPSYGNGPEGEKWIVEQHLVPLLRQLAQLVADPPRFLLFTCHTLGFSPVVMQNLLVPWVERFGGTAASGTMVLSHPDCRNRLPAGFFARWESPA